MQRISRRKVLQGFRCRRTGGGHRRPRRHSRHRAGTRLRPGHDAALVKFVDFVPVSDQLLKGKIKDECQKALGIDLSIETINGDGVQARISVGHPIKAGPDIMMAVSNWAQLYADSLVDVSDIADEVGKAQGGFFQTARGHRQ